MILSLLLSAAAAAAEPARFDAVAMMKLLRLSDPQVSPDGRQVLYTATQVDLEAGSRNNDLWVVPLAGGEPRRLTPTRNRTRAPRWSPDGAPDRVRVRARGRLAGVGDGRLGRGAEEGHVAADRGRRRVVGGRGDAARDLGRPSRVRRRAGAYDAACNQKKLDAAGKPSTARVYDELLYRHWDTWEDGRRTHLLVVPLEGGPVRDLTPGDARRAALQPGRPRRLRGLAGRARGRVRAKRRQGAGRLHQRRALRRARRRAEPRARSPAAPATTARRGTARTERCIAFRAQMRAGYESDRWRLMVYDRRAGAVRSLTEALRPPRRELRLVAPTRRRSSSPPATRAASRSSRCPPPAGRCAAWRKAPSATSRRRRTARSLSRRARSLTQPGRDLPHRARTAPARGAHARERRACSPRFGLRAGESVTYTRRGGQDVQAWIVKPPRLRPREEVPAARADPRRPAGRRGPTAGASAGTRRSSRAPATSSSCPTRAARPAGARSSSTTSTRTGAAAPTKT